MASTTHPPSSRRKHRSDSFQMMEPKTVSWRTRFDFSCLVQLHLRDRHSRFWKCGRWLALGEKDRGMSDTRNFVSSRAGERRGAGVGVPVCREHAAHRIVSISSTLLMNWCCSAEEKSANAPTRPNSCMFTIISSSCERSATKQTEKYTTQGFSN